jgi:hypothetical protein
MNERKFCRPNFGPDESEEYQEWAKFHSKKTKAAVKVDLNDQIVTKTQKQTYQDSTEKQVDLMSKLALCL